MGKIEIVTAMFLILVTTPVFAAQMCVKTNTYISIFRKNIDGTSAECANSTTDKTWRVTYDYRNITGFASCNTLDGSTNPTTVNTTSATTGVYCWCKIAPVTTYTNGNTTGVVSYWAYLKTYNTAEACADTVISGCDESHAGCTASCMNAMKSDSSFRGSIFNTIW